MIEVKGTGSEPVAVPEGNRECRVEIDERGNLAISERAQLGNDGRAFLVGVEYTDADATGLSLRFGDRRIIGTKHRDSQPARVWFGGSVQEAIRCVASINQHFVDGLTGPSRPVDEQRASR